MKRDSHCQSLALLLKFFRIFPLHGPSPLLRIRVWSWNTTIERDKWSTCGRAKLYLIRTCFCKGMDHSSSASQTIWNNLERTLAPSQVCRAGTLFRPKLTSLLHQSVSFYIFLSFSLYNQIVYLILLLQSVRYCILVKEMCIAGVDRKRQQRSWWSTAASAAFVLFTIFLGLPQCLRQRGMYAVKSKLNNTVADLDLKSYFKFTTLFLLTWGNINILEFPSQSWLKSDRESVEEAKDHWDA